MSLKLEIYIIATLRNENGEVQEKSIINICDLKLSK